MNAENQLNVVINAGYFKNYVFCIFEIIPKI